MDWEAIVGNVGNNQYKDRISVLQSEGMITESIENTVEETITNLNKQTGRSFVIFGEPQSGKTEMMIALNARLLDEGANIIVNLLTDSLDLLSQSLTRFRDSGLSPSPKQYRELPTDARALSGKKWIIFCKKNARDLEKLILLLRFQKRILVIDDEADYASPNAKVNRDEKTKINQLVCNLMGDDGQYIGVTATQARLNLNNTFENDTELWVDFNPHPYYVGQDFFFPSDGRVDYRLKTFSHDEGDERRELENAILHFLCGVAEQHQLGRKKGFTMLVHTSGKKDEHATDVDIIQSTINTLSNRTAAGFKYLVDRMLNIAKSYNPKHPNSIVEFVLRNIDRHLIVEINSKNSSGSVADIANPTSYFSFGAGGNIISRGVTFNNLLSMYFTRAVKGKFSQDTYIQRARMFGSRTEYKDRFQLWIPESLMANWSKCFEFHKLAIEAMRSSKQGAPVWLADHKTTPTSATSIDKSTVDFEGGEMSFAMFNYDPPAFERLMQRGNLDDFAMLERLRSCFNDDIFPDYLQKYLEQSLRSDHAQISFHKPSTFGTKASSYSPTDKQLIQRKKGLFANNEFKRSEHPDAKHHLKIFFNDLGKARLFYKIHGGSIRFMQNRK